MKKESKFYVKTTSGEFKITADYLKYETRESGDVIFFKKKFKGKKNPEDGTYDWDVAFVKSADVILLCLEDQIVKDDIPVTKRAIITKIVDYTVTACISYLIFKKMK